MRLAVLAMAFATMALIWTTSIAEAQRGPRDGATGEQRGNGNGARRRGNGDGQGQRRNRQRADNAPSGSKKAQKPKKKKAAAKKPKAAPKKTKKKASARKKKPSAAQNRNRRAARRPANRRAAARPRADERRSRRARRPVPRRFGPPRGYAGPPRGFGPDRRYERRRCFGRRFVADRLYDRGFDVIRMERVGPDFRVVAFNRRDRRVVLWVDRCTGRVVDVRRPQGANPQQRILRQLRRELKELF